VGLREIDQTVNVLTKRRTTAIARLALRKAFEAFQKRSFNPFRKIPALRDEDTSTSPAATPIVDVDGSGDVEDD
jgi:hypothetical protein